jgi:aspartate/tyrosine/aromatic aminotransferase
MFEKIEMAPADPILGLTDAFKKDTNPQKVNLGVGVYKDEEGKTPILNSVKAAEKIILAEEKTKSYLPIDGSPQYRKLVQQLIFTENNNLIKTGKIATVQTPGGTGGLKVASDFIKKFYPNAKIWLSNPTWANHNKIFAAAGLETASYPYYDAETNQLNFDGMYKTLSSLSENDIVLFHACCHNPTGTDISTSQWKKLATLTEKCKFVPFFDFAYQGFGDGIDEDAEGLRIFADKVDSFLVANSFSKNFGLYNERIGALSVICQNKEEADKVLSQLKICARTNYSNPPSHGAAIVSTILSSQDLKMVWTGEVKEMCNRINSFRKLLVENLKTHGCTRDFQFLNTQKGMFSYTGLSKEQVRELRSKYAIYFVDSGRINVAGLNNDNIDYVCKAFADILG